MQKIFLLSGALTGCLSVMIGAFGAHALKNFLVKTGRTETFETAVKYQFYHCFALLVLGLLMTRIQDRLMDYAGYSFIAGILVFSGSLYILCLADAPYWGRITPIGGLFLITGWVLLFVSVLRSGI